MGHGLWNLIPLAKARPQRKLQIPDCSSKARADEAFAWMQTFRDPRYAYSARPFLITEEWQADLRVVPRSLRGDQRRSNQARCDVNPALAQI
jgi:hypothetical protein